MTGPVTNPASSSLTTVKDTRDPALQKAAQGFEAVFLREIIGSMRKAKLADDVFGSSATDNFRQMADANLADNMSQMGRFGIAELIEQQFAGLVKDVKNE